VPVRPAEVAREGLGGRERRQLIVGGGGIGACGRCGRVVDVTGARHRGRTGDGCARTQAEIASENRGASAGDRRTGKDGIARGRAEYNGLGLRANARAGNEAAEAQSTNRAVVKFRLDRFHGGWWGRSKKWLSQPQSYSCRAVLWGITLAGNDSTLSDPGNRFEIL